jgi:PhnB protein
MSENVRAIAPYLSIKGAAAAIEFYKLVFGAKEVGRLTMGGTIGHAQLEIEGSTIMLAEEMPDWGNKSPTTLGDSPVTIALYVSDVDTVFQRALNAGATTLEAVKDQFYGYRAGTLADPFGHRWHILTFIQAVAYPEMQKHCDAMFAEMAKTKK